MKIKDLMKIGCYSKLFFQFWSICAVKTKNFSNSLFNGSQQFLSIHNVCITFCQTKCCLIISEF